MLKKKVHIISHSHWDREWYMPFEQHHMRLVTLIDELLDMIQKEPTFDSFHLDGQTIILDDYISVRPDREKELRKAIADGKLQIGPFYILQDDFLISGESNIRNILIGLEESYKWGNPVPMGYFPDTFGNMGQAPQLLLKSGISTAAFGRGVKTTGAGNTAEYDEKYSSKFSEMWWQSPDGSKVFTILFANWYSNGNEIPVEKVSAKVFWDKKLAEVEQYASTNQLLMMNGSDHQPLQKNILKAIEVANQLYPDYEFIHSNFKEYLSAVTEEIPDDLSTIEGELTSQETDGWYTLANTASARIYLKQRNTDVQRQLENLTEPLASMAYEVVGEYPHDQLNYAWKLLLQNHPHDSICGCSVDEVHQEMLVRFSKSLEVGKYLAQEALTVLTNEIDTSSFSPNSRPFVLFNTSGHERTEVIEREIEWLKVPFTVGGGESVQNFDELEEFSLPPLKIVDYLGREIEGEILGTEVKFGYELPKDGFRVSYMRLVVKVRISVTNLSGLSWISLALTEDKEDRPVKQVVKAGKKNTIENQFVEVSVQDDGRLTITDKKTRASYNDFLTYENVGDIGNEYIFKEPSEEQRIYANNFPAEVEIITNSRLRQEIEIRQKILIPKESSPQLDREMKSFTEFRQRKAQRSQELVPLILKTRISLDWNSPQIKCQLNFNNQMTNHRLRVLFPTNLKTNTHRAESIYEVVERPNQPEKNWENPTNPQHQQAFVAVSDEKHGIVIGNYGLNEYEILAEQTTIAVTLLRAVGEMADWGYFPTPEAQCQGEQECQFTIELSTEETVNQAYQRVQDFQVPIALQQTGRHGGKLAAQRMFAEIKGTTFLLTSCKRKNKTNDLVLRGYNLSNHQFTSFSQKVPGYSGFESDLLENPGEEWNRTFIGKSEIVTSLWRNNN